MPERRDSWLARFTGADQRQAELERVTAEASALRTQLSTQRALTEQQTCEIDRLAQQREQLEEQVEQLTAQGRLAETATRSGIRQTQAAQQRIAALQQAVSQRDEELSLLRAAHDKVLKKNDTLEERLSRNEHELRTVHENLSADRAALSRVIEERSALRTRAEQRDRELSELVQQLDAVEAAQQRAVLEERQRWLALVTRFWKALVRALGPTASVPLARELDGEALLGPLVMAESAEVASAALGRALGQLSLCQRVSIASQGRELELRLQEPAGDGKDAQGWVGVFAVQCLGSLLGRSLQPYGLHDEGGELVVRARFRDREAGEPAAHMA